MAGLRNICRALGSMKVNDTLWLWDYVADKPVMEKDMDSERWAASERKRAELLAQQFAASRSE